MSALFILEYSDGTLIRHQLDHTTAIGVRESHTFSPVDAWHGAEGLKSAVIVFDGDETEIVTPAFHDRPSASSTTFAPPARMVRLKEPKEPK